MRDAANESFLTQMLRSLPDICGTYEHEPGMISL